MKWIKQVWFRILKFIGCPISSFHKNCISSLEERLFEIDDDEHLIALKMLGAGHDCDSVFNTLRIARRKRSFKRKLSQLGIKGANLEHLLEQYMNELRGSTKIDDLVNKANQKYLDSLLLYLAFF